MTSTEIAEAEVVPQAELVPHEPHPANLFGTDNPVEVMARATAVADVLKKALTDRGMISNISGKEFVTVEGWQTLGGLVGVSAVVTDTERIELDGKVAYKARVEARTLDGRVIGAAEAVCSKGETRGPWKNAPDYALLSMAQTRATSKALKGPLGFIVKLAGYDTTPAEEMAGVEPEQKVQSRAANQQEQAKAINRDTYHALVSAFHEGPRSVEELAEWLGCDPKDVGPGVAALDVARAMDLAKWLEPA